MLRASAVELVLTEDELGELLAWLAPAGTREVNVRLGDGIARVDAVMPVLGTRLGLGLDLALLAVTPRQVRMAADLRTAVPLPGVLRRVALGLLLAGARRRGVEFRGGVLEIDVERLAAATSLRCEVARLDLAPGRLVVGLRNVELAPFGRRERARPGPVRGAAPRRVRVRVAVPPPGPFGLFAFFRRLGAPLAWSLGAAVGYAAARRLWREAVEDPRG